MGYDEIDPKGDDDEDKSGKYDWRKPVDTDDLDVVVPVDEIDDKDKEREEIDIDGDGRNLRIVPIVYDTDQDEEDIARIRKGILDSDKEKNELN